MDETPSAVDGPPRLEIAGAVATITFSRPREHNRIDPDDLGVLHAHLDEVAGLPAIRAVVFTGAGTTTFSSGFTIEAIVERLDQRFEEALDAIEKYPLPTICALNGSVYGGATDLALCCDFRIGIHGTRMFMPAARFGLHYHPGGLRRFVTQLGPAQTKKLFLTAQTIDAQTMLRIGFLTDLVSREAFQPRIDDYLALLGKCDPAVVRSMKRQIDAIAAGERTLATSRRYYEESLRSNELRDRIGALAKGK